VATIKSTELKKLKAAEDLAALAKAMEERLRMMQEQLDRIEAALQSARSGQKAGK